MQESGLGQSNIETSAPVESSAPVEQSTPTERTFRQNEVNDLVKRVKHEAVEDYRRLQTTQPQYVEQKYGSQQPSEQRQQSPSNAAMSESDYRRVAAEEVQRSRDQWIADGQARSEQDNAQRIVQNFWDKTATGKDKYDDFEKMTGDIEYSRFPNVVQLLSEHVDNADDVLYELGKDRLKMSQLEQLSGMSPKDAIVHVKRLADSIKNNQAAGRIRTPNAPLSQQRPSNTGTDAGGPLTSAQLRAKYKR